jgi:hypothetical protein
LAVVRELPGEHGMQLRNYVSLAFTASLAACAIDDADSLDETTQAVLSGWTPFTSEEYPPVVCDGQSLPSRVHVTGPYADNIQLYCQQDTRIQRTDSYWTPYFSEEYRSMMYCQPHYWVTGLACQGRYCDNVALQCSQILYSRPSLVSGTLFVSEEQGGSLDFYPNKYPIAMQCDGPYCDNLRFATGYLNIEPPDLTDRVE